MKNIVLSALIFGSSAFFASIMLKDDTQDPYRYVEPSGVVVVNNEEVECLAKNVYFEARNQSPKGMAAVAWATLNRVDSPRYPDTVCDVVWQPKQYSWTHDGKSDTPRATETYQEAVRVSLIVMYYYLSGASETDPTDGSTMFHADYVDPFWADSYNHVAKIDGHLFYKAE